MTTPTIRICGECGKPLAADGDCPVCAIKRALSLSGQASEAQVIEQAGDRIGRYKLLEKIGEGGYGSVYMAEQAEPIRRRVALKIVKLGMDTRQVVARFEAERQALALMDHPNIAKVLDAGATETGRPYFVMELVRGVKITDYCDQQSLTTKERLDLFIQVCHAVQHAHQKGIIHRDLKPSNILVTRLDGKPMPKVIDFGIAKATGQQLLTDKTLFTAFQQFIGTPAYMSPEQAEMSGADVDTRSDIYALGALLYELLTGRLPFESKELLQAGFDEMRRIIREQEPPRPSTRLSSLSGEDLTTVAKRRQAEPPKLIHLVRGDLDWIVMKCLEKDRARRYETATGLAQDIQRHLSDEPVTARAPGAFYRFQKMVRRNKLAFGVVTTVALALTLGIVVSTWQAVRATRAEREKGVLYERAEQAAAEVKVALSASDFKEAIRLIEHDKGYDALAYLVRSLKSNPTNTAALTRLTTLLTYRSWPLLGLGAMNHNTNNGGNSAQFSPDGKRVVTASDDGTAQVWDSQSGQRLAEPMKHDKWVYSAQFSPDGKRIVTASGDRTARVWDTESGKPLTEPMKHDKSVHSAQFSPDGKRILTVSTNIARVWDAQGGRPLTEPMKHDKSVRSAQFSPDGKRIVTISENTVQMWDAKSGQPLAETMSFTEGEAALAFSPDGKRVVTASFDKTRWVETARVWDLGSGKPQAVLMKHDRWMTSAQFSPDGKRIVTTSGDRTARVWDSESGKALSVPMKHDGTVRAAQFSRDGKRIVTASEDRTARVWDAQSGQPLTEPMKHDKEVTSAQFSPDGKQVVTASWWNNTARVWDVQSGEALAVMLRHPASPESAEFSPDGKRIVTASGFLGGFQVWDAQSGRSLTESIEPDASVRSAQFSPDGKWILTTSDYGTARVWDAQSGQAVSKPMDHHKSGLSAQFSPDGKRVMTTSAQDKTARVWDAQSGKSLTESIKHDAGVHSAQFGPDGRRVVTASDDHTARVWDAQSGQPLTDPLKHEKGVVSVQFSPDGKRIVTASYDGTARLWDAQSGKALAEPMKHNQGVHSAQFSPDGKRIVTASEKTARVWDAQSGQPLTDPLKHEQGVVSAQFSPDGQRIVTASGNGTARIWDAHSGQPLTEPLKQDDSGVVSARFSPDGNRIVTAGGGDLCARVWDIAPSGLEFPDWLLVLAKGVSGQALNKQGVLEATREDWAKAVKRIRQRLDQGPAKDDWVVWGRWFLADRATRTISPFSKVSVQEQRKPRGG